MATSVLLERSSAAAAPFTGPVPGWNAGAFPGGAPAAAQWCVLPRCKIEFEKCSGGFKIHCKCDDEVACGTLQNLCRMLSDGLCSCCCTLNGIPVCQCSLSIGICKCEYTKDGCCVTCLSGDKACCAMLQACCDCLACCCKSGCCCYVCFNNTPVCCGTHS
jgi:hypothetical protein